MSIEYLQYIASVSHINRGDKKDQCRAHDGGSWAFGRHSSAEARENLPKQSAGSE